MKRRRREEALPERGGTRIGRVGASTTEPARHGATVTLSADRTAGLSLEMRLSASGLIAVGGMISSILLATAVLVGVAIRESRRARAS